MATEMVDTIKISLKINNEDDYNKLKSSFDTTITVDNKGIIKSEKHYKNESFGYTLHPATDIVNFPILTIDGSISKQLRGNNWKNHYFEPEKDEKRFYDLISNETNMKWCSSDLCFISRFDVGLNIEDLDPTSLINQVFKLSPARMEKHIWNGSFRAGNKTRQLRIYDKKKEILDNTDDKKIKETLSDKIITRIETQLVRDRNIQKRHGIKTISDILTLEKQKTIFFDTYNKIVKINKIREMENKNTEKLKLKEFRELQELKTVINDFGELESYRKFLILNGYDSGNVSRTISRLRELLQFLEKDTLINLSDRINEEMGKLEKYLEM